MQWNNFDLKQKFKQNIRSCRIAATLKSRQKLKISRKLPSIVDQFKWQSEDYNWFYSSPSWILHHVPYMPKEFPRTARDGELTKRDNKSSKVNIWNGKRWQEFHVSSSSFGQIRNCVWRQPSWHEPTTVDLSLILCDKRYADCGRSDRQNIFGGILEDTRTNLREFSEHVYSYLIRLSSRLKQSYQQGYCRRRDQSTMDLLTRDYITHFYGQFN